MNTIINSDYLQFDELETFLNNKPSVRSIWATFDDETKKAYHFDMIQILENHSWRGKPLSPQQETAFPRIINGKLITWNSDYQKHYNHLSFYDDNCLILPVYWIAEAVANQILQRNNHELSALQKIGVSKSKIDVIETEFDSVKNNQWSQNPLPEPLWLKMHTLSIHYKPANKNRFFRVERS